MKKNTLLIIVLFSFTTSLLAQENFKIVSAADSAKYYIAGDSYVINSYNNYEVKSYIEPKEYSKPKNIILMIGDGMGVAQIYSGLTANKGSLNLCNFKQIGFQTTYSADNYITDSGAAGTALACGQKTYNSAIGVNTDRIAIENIREKMEKRGMATGVVSTSAITHATPASFVAHQPLRSMYEDIAADFLKTDIDVFIGGGYTHFTDRVDGKDLTIELEAKGYTVLTDIDDIAMVTDGKLAGLLAPEHIIPKTEGRGNMLEKATHTALNILDNDSLGFFIMIEGSQIDWGCHQHKTSYIVTEMLDFDQAIGQVLEFAVKNKETLVIVTADHETGGFAINGGSLETGDVTGGFTTTGHTAVMVPVFAFGPGSELFCGFYNNIDIPKKIMRLIEE